MCYRSLLRGLMAVTALCIFVPGTAEAGFFDGPPGEPSRLHAQMQQPPLPGQPRTGFPGQVQQQPPMPQMPQQPPMPQQYQGQQMPGIQPVGPNQPQMQQMPGTQPPMGMPGQQMQQPPMPGTQPQIGMPGQQVPGMQLPMGAPGQQMEGPCTVKISGDRSVVSLVDSASGQTRNHIALNPDRVQKVFTSPDASWSLVMFKVRGRQQFGLIPVDLAECEVQDSIDIPVAAQSAQFEGDEVVLLYPDGKGHKVRLRKSGL